MTFLGLNLQDWANASTILGVIVGGLALVYSAIQLRISSRVSQAQFWLDLREMFADKHQEIHLKLRNGLWSNDDARFPSEPEWASLEAYMGLFEHCEKMLEQGLLDAPTFESIYGYRLERIVENPLIVREKLVGRRWGWRDFIHLLERVENRLPQTRYLIGFWEGNHGVLWHGTAVRAQINEKFGPNGRPELERQYRAAFAQLKDRPGAIQYAWLRCNGHTIESWRGV
jgi:hypothetical protein